MDSHLREFMFSTDFNLGDGIAQSVERRTCSPDELERVREFETRPIQLSRHSPWYRVVGTILVISNWSLRIKQPNNHPLNVCVHNLV